MTEKAKPRDAALAPLEWPLRLTRLGMLTEQVTRAFWPLWSILFALFAALAFGLADPLSPVALWVGAGLAAAALAAALIGGIRRFSWPGRDAALARLDATMPDRPIAALRDAQALGVADTGSVAVWRAHVARMVRRAGEARAPAPDLRLSQRDRFALRYAALVAVVLAVLFGSFWRAADVVAAATGGAARPIAGGPSWEGWAEPPSYTGRPSLYLNSLAAGALDLPRGSLLTLRLYGPAEAMTVTETVSGRAADSAPAAGDPAADAAEAGDMPRLVEFTADQSGRVTIDGEGGREWAVTVLPDAAPTVALAGAISREADGTMSQPFEAADDYGVTGGLARFTLDLAEVERRFGLAPTPEPREALEMDLPLPVTGSRADFTEALVGDASKHPWANLPVTLVLTVEDGLGQSGQSETQALILPGRRFFDPVAAAVIEMRRDLLWTRDNAPRVAQLLHALTHRPEGLLRNERAYLMLRVAMRRLDSAVAQGRLSPGMRDESAEALWEIAMLIEDGGLADALDRMTQAQERLSEAIRNGATPEEIQKLMDELRQATDDYIRMLAERGETDPADRFTQNQQGQQITGDQIQQLMDEIQRLMEEGRMAEAQELLEQLQRLMENLRVTQGPGGEGQQGEGGQALQDLRQTLRDQQGLSDEAFRDLQQQFGQGGGMPNGSPPPGAEGEGQPGGEGETAEGEAGRGAGEEGRLADRQRALRDELDRQRGALPGAEGAARDAARQALDQAGRAMEDAERALRDGETAGAIERQAEAIEKLREGLRNLGEALASDQRPGQGEAEGQAGREVPRDPLGRSTGQTGRTGTDENLLQGDDIYRRARDILDEIRRRSGDRTRPEVERDYLRRLLDRF
ncbi:MAG: TIGR02302 family protein [Alphaproteobacteria bacterium HGW-Alphaproteobacteria-6]|nr:MAG: TIGR02302 family protein [Alphaproteobacteria bacterium HGW-Alphaproteobacteria-6]